MERHNFRERRTKPKSNFLWYFLRISFWVMIFFWVLLTFLPEEYNILIFSYLFLAAILATFVSSIVHLVKYKQKAFAIVALVISSIGLFFFLIGFVLGVIEGLSAAGI